MPQPPDKNSDSDITIIVNRYVESRRAGRRPSIDEFLPPSDSPAHREQMRAAVLKAIYRKSRLGELSRTALADGEIPAEEPVWTAEIPDLEGYDLIDEVGRGGMGMVYEAYQCSTGRRVAVKFMLERIIGSESARRRFEREIELVARLQHPNIVPVLDSGLHHGRPYSVMGFIEGRPLDLYVEEEELSPRQVLAIFAKICEPVDYAHQHGVLHRDLKPSNVLIDAEGEPHLLDFGLAKAFDPESADGPQATLSVEGQLMGTLGYMSPEQSRGETGLLSVRSDVYSLGAMAYEMMTGGLPFPLDGSMEHILHRIAEVDPPRPSSLSKELKPDLDAILLKALEKSPQNRYSTAGELAKDIRRFLGFQTVSARRPSPLVRVGRLVRRNRTVSAVSAAAAIIITLIAVTSINRIVKERDGANAANDFTDDYLLVFGANESGGTNASKVAYLRKAADNLKRLENQPIALSRMRIRLGKLFMEFEEYDEAKEHFKKALEIRQELYGENHEAVAEAWHQSGRPYYYTNQKPEAKKRFERALILRRRLLGDDDPSVAETVQYLASTLRDLGNDEEAETQAREALRIRRLHPENAVAIGEAGNTLGRTLLKLKRPAEAENLFHEALRTLEELPERKPLFEARVMQNLAKALSQLERYEESRDYFQKAIDIKTRQLDENSATVGLSLLGLARVTLNLDHSIEAMTHARRAQKIFQEKNIVALLKEVENLILEIQIVLDQTRKPETSEPPPPLDPDPSQKN